MKSGSVEDDVGGARLSGRTPGTGAVATTLEFAFGAAFRSIGSIRLRAGRGERLTVSDLMPAASGRYWVADAMASVLKVYSQQGQRIRTLSREATGLRQPVSLAPLHVRWVAVVDRLPAVSILDESGRLLRRFPLPELDRPLQICNLGDRWLAVVGSGWGRGSGKLVHLYTPAGEHVESLFGEPRAMWSPGRAYAAAIGKKLYVGHADTDSFAVLDIEGSSVLSFASLTARIARRLGPAAGFAGTLRGLFATACGPLIAVYTERVRARRYLYDMYSLDGAPLALGVQVDERVVGVEGALFYSVRPARAGGVVLRIWRAKYRGNGGVGVGG